MQTRQYNTSQHICFKYNGLKMLPENQIFILAVERQSITLNNIEPHEEKQKKEETKLKQCIKSTLGQKTLQRWTMNSSRPGRFAKFSHFSIKSWYDTKIHHDDVIKWKPFPRYGPYVRGIHRSPVNSPHKVQWRGALMFPWSVPLIIDWVNSRKAGDLRHHLAYYDVIVMTTRLLFWRYVI